MTEFCVLDYAHLFSFFSLSFPPYLSTLPPYHCFVPIIVLSSDCPLPFLICPLSDLCWPPISLPCPCSPPLSTHSPVPHVSCVPGSQSLCLPSRSSLSGSSSNSSCQGLAQGALAPLLCCWLPGPTYPALRPREASCSQASSGWATSTMPACWLTSHKWVRGLSR